MSDNTTPLSAAEYNEQIGRIIPYYSEFHKQAVSVVKSMRLDSISWLDTGCGTGMLALLADAAFEGVRFVLTDPSEKMIEQAKINTNGINAKYYTVGSQDMAFKEEFNVVTAVQAHHYLDRAAREKAVKNIYGALKDGGIFISFENVIPDNEEIKELELERWAEYQISQGKTPAEAAEHKQRCGSNYFPITAKNHENLLKKSGFRKVHIFWISYMQMGIYGIK